MVGHSVQRLLGFWLVYHAMGGLEPMIASGLWPKSTAYKQLADFRAFFNCDPDEMEPELAAAIAQSAADWPKKYRDGRDAALERERKKRPDTST